MPFCAASAASSTAHSADGTVRRGTRKVAVQKGARIAAPALRPPSALNPRQRLLSALRAEFAQTRRIQSRFALLGVGLGCLLRKPPSAPRGPVRGRRCLPCGQATCGGTAAQPTPTVPASLRSRSPGAGSPVSALRAKARLGGTAALMRPVPSHRFPLPLVALTVCGRRCLLRKPPAAAQPP